MSTLDTQPLQLDIVIQTNEDLSLPFYYYSDDAMTIPIDLTGYVISMQLRKRTDSTTTIADWSTSTGEITTDPTNGAFTLDVPESTLAAITDSTAVYDISLVDSSSNTDVILKGNISFVEGVTR